MSAQTDNESIDSFSECHAGIVNHLKDLDRLPPLLAPAMQACQIAAEAVRFFRSAVFEHHNDEERELFPAVLADAAQGEERNKMQEIVDRLVREHRHLESIWSKLEPALSGIAHGTPSNVDVKLLEQLVSNYMAHAQFEEENFLPLAKAILGRKGEHLAALGLRLHMRHKPLVSTPF
jgi:hemerythrin-like domain-containing protein